MKFISSDPNFKSPFTFADVPVARFFVDRTGELMFKYSDIGAIVIADKFGNMQHGNMRHFPNMDQSWDVQKILPYDKVEF